MNSKLNFFDKLNLKIHHGGSFLGKTVQTNFNILHLNIQSLRNKLTSFTDFIDFSKISFQIIVLTETHIKKDESHYFDLPGYKAAHCTREGRLSGGVSIFVRKDFSDFTVIHSMDFDLNSSLLIELNRTNTKILGFYKYRNCDFSKFTNHLTKTLETHSSCIAVGDFNLDLFNIDTSLPIRNYHDIIICNGYIFLNELSEATRVDKTRGSKTLIDHAFSDLPLLHPHYKFTFYLDEIFGDHKAFLITIDTHSHLPKLPSRTIKITSTNHAKIQENKAIENMIYCDMETFQTELSKTLDKYTSTRVRKDRFRKPFMNTEIITLIAIRQNYFQLHNHLPWSSKAETRYKYYRNLVTKKIREAKIAFYDKKFQNDMSDSKKFWRTVNNLLTNSDGKPDSSCKILSPSGTNVTNRLVIANTFNRHFTSVAIDIKNSITIDKLHFDLLHDQEEYSVLQPISEEDLYTTEEEILATISRLKN